MDSRHDARSRTGTTHSPKASSTTLRSRLAGRHRGRRRHRRRGVHRALDRLLPGAARPVAAHRRSREGLRRVRRLRPQRRLGVGLLPTSWEAVAKESSRDEALRMQRAANAAVDDVGKVAADEGIDGHYAKGGYLRVATSPLQWDRLQQQLAHAREWDQTEDDVALLDRREATARIDADGVFGGLYTPHCAAIHPARMVRGLAAAAERRGVTIYEGTEVTAIEPGVVRTALGDRPRRGGRSGARGLHREPAAVPTRTVADVLADDRHRAPPRPRVGRDRVARSRDPQRRPPLPDLRTAHRRRPHRARRSWCALPLGVSDRPLLRAPARRSRRAAAQPGQALPRPARRGRHPPLGRRPRRSARLVPVGPLRPVHGVRHRRRVRR